ncbi:putative quinol monooxygenase [Salegentibacter sp. F14]
MLKRIVKMSFEPDRIEEFLANFEANKSKIRNFEGCRHLELLRDKDNTNRFFTYSYWVDQAALENYRNSALFKGIWTETKAMFNERPEAWSVESL